MTSTWVETLAALVRIAITLGLISGFIFLSLKGRIAEEVYTNMVLMVVTWWFATRDKGQRSTDPPQANGVPKP